MFPSYNCLESHQQLSTATSNILVPQAANAEHPAQADASNAPGQGAMTVADSLKATESSCCELEGKENLVEDSNGDDHPYVFSSDPDGSNVWRSLVDIRCQCHINLLNAEFTITHNQLTKLFFCFI
jgi:hypothetical protein